MSTAPDFGLNVCRTLTLYPKEQYGAQLAARQRQQTREFKKLYGERAGIESTMSQGLRRISPFWL